MRAKHLACAAATFLTSGAWVAGVLAADDQADDSESSRTLNTPAKDAKRSRSTTTEESAGQVSDGDRTHPHAGQFSLRLALVGAERIISRFDSSPTCGLAAASNDPKTFCGFGAPLALDLAIGFAPINAVEPFAWARFGLGAETTTHTSPLVVLGAGARFYTARDAAFKFFLQPAVGWELESGTGSRPFDGKEYKKDFLLQLLAGPQFDFSNNVGAFAAVGVTAGMLRAIQTWLEFDIGIQARF